MTEVTIYTDGACSGNPGPGGWAAVLLSGEYRKEISGAEKETTNNRMEITAVLMALEALKRPCEVSIYSDSEYLINTMTKGWIWSWIRRGWKKSNGDPVENRDLWEKMMSLVRIHKVAWNKVKGHADVELNNRCDELARGAIRSLRERA